MPLTGEDRREQDLALTGPPSERFRGDTARWDGRKVRWAASADSQ
jgi:hypothetical protein